MEDIMLKDRRDDFDDNDDIDLTGMIHEYNEDNELRRKINELKKQKANTQEQPAFHPNDSALMGDRFSNIKEETRIPDIRVDHEAEKTRVGFNDDGDKTLVIMDRKSKVETKPEDMYDDYSYVEMQDSKTAFRGEHKRNEETIDDLRSEIKSKKSKKNNEPNDEEDLKAKKLNKIIMITIISIISIVVLVGAGFGIKYAFFNGDDKDEEVVEKDTPKTATKKPVITDNNKDDIKDNSAIITQLRSQLKTYEDQLAEVNTKLIEAQSTLNLQQGKLDAIPVLKQNLDAASQLVTESDKRLPTLKGTMDTACKLDAKSEACTKATSDHSEEVEKNKTLITSRDTSQVAYDTEYNQTADYTTKLKTAQDNLDALGKQKTALEVKVADTNTKLAQYN